MSVPAVLPEPSTPSGLNMIYTNPAKPVTRLTLEAITHEGTPGEKKQTFDLSPDKSKQARCRSTWSRVCARKSCRTSTCMPS